MPLALCVPARRLASCQLTTRARMSPRTGSPNTSSANSMSPTSWLSRLRTVSFMPRLPLSARFPPASLPARAPRRPRRWRRRPPRPRGASQGRRERQTVGRLALDRILDQHPAAFAARHRALDHQQAALGIGDNHLQALRRYPLGPEMAGHLLVLEGLARVRALPGRAVAAVRDRDAVGRAQPAEIVPLHRAAAT